MAKIVSLRERVHQPFFDCLVRTAGTTTGSLSDTTALFTSNGARSEANTNLINGSTLPSDQSFVCLALRCFTWYRNPILRVDGGVATEVAGNGDYGLLTPFLVSGGSVGNAPGSIQDVWRLQYQTEEQLHWTFGAGLKPSIENMPTWYFPAAGGVSGDFAGATDIIFTQNGSYDTGLLKLARAILIPPRQNLKCSATIHALPDGGQSQNFGLTQGSRNMLSLRDNLNAPDLIQKTVMWVLDGLFSRDVQ